MVEFLSVTYNRFQTIPIDERERMDFEYILNDQGGVTIVEYLGDSLSVVIPSAISDDFGNQVPVTVIGESAFSCHPLESVVIPEGVEIIEDFAFHGCSNLKHVTFPSTLRRMEDMVFDNCESLISVSLPDGLEHLGQSSFSGCVNLRSIHLGKSITSIDKFLLFDCESLEEVSIPEGVRDIRDHAFAGCSSLEYMVVPDSVHTIERMAFARCVSMKAIHLGHGLRTIGGSAFESCSGLLSVTLPDSLMNIGGDAFKECSSLRMMVIPDSVIGVGDGAFSMCTELRGVVIGRGVEHLGKLTFENCKALELFDVSEDNRSFASADGILYDGEFGTLVACPSAMEGDLIVPDGVYAIGDRAFSYCSKLSSITLPECLETIGDFAFHGCGSITEFIIPEGVDSIGQMAFSMCTSLKEMYIPDMVMSIGSAPFSGCSSLEHITVGAGNTDYVSVDGVLFTRDMRSLIRYPSMKSGKEYVVPEGVVTIERTAFMKCRELEVLVIPNTVGSVEKFGFAGSKALRRIVFLGLNPELKVDLAALSFLDEGVVFECDGKEFGDIREMMSACSELVLTDR